MNNKIKKISKLAEIERNAASHLYHISLHGQPTVVVTFETLKDLAKEIQRIFDEITE